MRNDTDARTHSRRVTFYQRPDGVFVGGRGGGLTGVAGLLAGFTGRDELAMRAALTVELLIAADPAVLAGG